MKVVVLAFAQYYNMHVTSPNQELNKLPFRNRDMLLVQPSWTKLLFSGMVTYLRFQVD